MRRALPAAVAVIAALTGALLPVSTTSAVTPVTAAKAAAQVKTPFVMGGSAFGTRVVGSAVPAGSAETGYQVMGCNRIANKARSNYIASVAVPGLGTVAGARTRVWTEKKGNRTSSIAQHTIAGVDLLDTPLGKLSIGAIESQSEAFNKGGVNGRFGTRVVTSVAKIVFTPPGGSPTTLALPTPGVPVTVPGLVSISIGKKTQRSGADFAIAGATGLRIKLIPTDTEVVIGKTSANLMTATTRGLFNGYGAGVEARIVGDTAQIGKTAYQPLSCIGTDGENVIKRLASADLSPIAETGLTAGGVNARKTGVGAAVAKTAGTVADVVLLDGALEIKAVTGVADIRRTADGKLKTSTKGTHVGAILVNGDSYSLDQLGKLEIPGLARLQGKVVERLPNGLKVVGLRVTLLDGSLAVVDLGVAVAKIRPTKKS